MDERFRAGCVPSSKNAKQESKGKKDTRERGQLVVDDNKKRKKKGGKKRTRRASTLVFFEWPGSFVLPLGLGDGIRQLQRRGM